MKRFCFLVLVLGIVSGMGGIASAQPGRQKYIDPKTFPTVPIDAGAQFSPENMRNDTQEAAYLVVTDGYRCDSISFIGKAPESPLEIWCNQGNYRYKVYAAGGRIKVVPTN